MFTDTFTIDIPYITGDSTVFFPMIAGLVVVLIIKWIIDILP